MAVACESAGGRGGVLGAAGGGARGEGFGLLGADGGRLGGSVAVVGDEAREQPTVLYLPCFAVWWAMYMRKRGDKDVSTEDSDEEPLSSLSDTAGSCGGRVGIAMSATKGWSSVLSALAVEAGVGCGRPMERRGEIMLNLRPVKRFMLP